MYVKNHANEAWSQWWWFLCISYSAIPRSESTKWKFINSQFMQSLIHTVPPPWLSAKPVHIPLAPNFPKTLAHFSHIRQTVVGEKNNNSLKTRLQFKVLFVLVY